MPQRGPWCAREVQCYGGGGGGHADQTHGRGWRGTDAAVDIVVSQARGLSQRRSIAHISEYSIVTYERKPRHWRAAIFPKARIGRVGGETVLSVVTPDDFPSEAEAQFAAEKLIRKL